jgi:predicted Zn-dependent protease
MKFWAGLAMVILLGTAPSVFAAGELPALDSASATAPDESRLGDAFLRKLRASTDVIDDPLLQAWVENLSYQLAFHADMPQPDLQVVLIPDRRINAFAVPGGIIGVNAGLFLYAENESEFAAVLAHELAHVQQRHYARSRDQAGKDNWIYLGALLASIALAASGSDSDAAMAVGISSQAAMVQQQLAYSRLHEQEADRIGMQTLAAAGYTPMAMPSFFGRLERESRQVGFLPDFLLTHPLTQDRIADSLNRARSLPQTGMADSRAYRLIRQRLLAMSGDADQQSLSGYQQQLKEKPDLEEARFGLALTLKNLRRFDQARSELDTLLLKHPGTVDYVIARADVELADNKPEAALAILRQALALTPDSVSLRLYAAHAANLALQPEQAVGWLEPLSRSQPRDPSVWDLLSEAALQRKDAVGVLRARAESRFLNGSGEKAVKDLEQAIRLAKDNYPLQAKLQSRLDAIRLVIRDDRDIQ